MSRTAVLAPPRSATPAVEERRAKDVGIVAKVATLLALAIVFGLPHAVIPLLLGPDRPYTPFAVSGVSALTYDKTVTYAALVNYTALRNAPPYDTDVFENRDLPTPTSTAPYFALAALDKVLGGVDRAFIVSDILLPPLAALLLYLLIVGLTESEPIALLGAVVTILVPFGPRNFLAVPLALAPGGSDSIIQPLEYSRSLHPEVSFTLLAAALLFLWRTLRRGRGADPMLAGVCGGLLFYTYVYYWPVWVGACALLLVASYFGISSQTRNALWVTNLSTWVVGVPFWVLFLLNRNAPSFKVLIERHISELGHVPPPGKLLYTFICIATFTACAAAYYRFHPRKGGMQGTETWNRVLLFHAVIFVSAIAAMNMEVVTGFNVESMLHYPNRLLQPFFSLVFFALVLPCAIAYFSRHVPRHSPNVIPRSAYAGVTILVAVGLARQVVMSVNVADEHEFAPEQALLFSWLNANTRLDDVVVATGRDVNELIPVYTHDRPFVPSGERTSANDQEVMRRFLVGMKLLDRSPEYVQSLLEMDSDHADPPLGLTYTYFLFVGGDGIINRRLPESAIAQAMAEYRQLNLKYELAKQRVDYIYARGSERPAKVDDWTFTPAYETAYGSVWHVRGIGS